jgi:6-phosphogluconolactonase
VPRDVRVLPDPAALARAAAGLFADAARRAAAERGRFVVALAGGSTPRAAYELLAGPLGADVPWARVHVCFGDERGVPPDDAASNYAMARDALLARVPVPEAQVYRLEGEREPADAAARADALLRGLLGDGGLDLALLGMGADGHTASLFPGSPALDERERWVVATEAPPGVTPRPRLTLTLPALAQARHVVVLVAGAEKRDALRRALADEPPLLPVARVRGREATTFLVDAAAAG